MGVGSVTPPCVAQRVWAMPRMPARPSSSAAFSISETRPIRRTRWMPLFRTAIPAES